MQRPSDTEYAPFYAGYVALVPETDVLAALEGQVGEIRRRLAPVTGERERQRYAEGKWSIRQVLGHLVDGERVFGYRAFCFSRGEAASLPSFDENQYVSSWSRSSPSCDSRTWPSSAGSARASGGAWERRAERR